MAEEFIATETGAWGGEIITSRACWELLVEKQPMPQRIRKTMSNGQEPGTNIQMTWEASIDSSPYSVTCAEPMRSTSRARVEAGRQGSEYRRGQADGKGESGDQLRGDRDGNSESLCQGRQHARDD